MTYLNEISMKYLIFNIGYSEQTSQMLEEVCVLLGAKWDIQLMWNDLPGLIQSSLWSFSGNVIDLVRGKNHMYAKVTKDQLG